MTIRDFEKILFKIHSMYACVCFVYELRDRHRTFGIT